MEINGFNFELWTGYIGPISPALLRNRTSDTLVYGKTNDLFVRRLMPIETERLMGFPDNHTRIEWDGNTEEDCPDTPRYKCCGNSMCVNCMEWIGRRISMVESIIKEENKLKNKIF